LFRVKISPKGDWLALGGGDQLIVWEWGTQSYVLQSQNQGHNVSCVAYSPCGSKLATGGTDGTVKVWSTNSGFCQVTWARQPVYKKQAQRQVFWLKIWTGYWTEIFRAEFQTEKQNRFLIRRQDSRQDLRQSF
jgi:WD40 repeat protein